MAGKDKLGDGKTSAVPVKIDDAKIATVPDSKKANAAVENLRTA